ncbi:flagellar hook-length control protein FliK [Thiopseudomonas alkaliphila]|uniref:flagellar hook-length control protein FliK n=1 Tax=Thiopseudomonas alkaliphila TaxID=1697053 RepID=UPI0035715302
MDITLLLATHGNTSTRSTAQVGHQALTANGPNFAQQLSALAAQMHMGTAQPALLAEQQTQLDAELTQKKHPTELDLAEAAALLAQLAPSSVPQPLPTAQTATQSSLQPLVASMSTAMSASALASISQRLNLIEQAGSLHSVQSHTLALNAHTLEATPLAAHLQTSTTQPVHAEPNAPLVAPQFTPELNSAENADRQGSLPTKVEPNEHNLKIQQNATADTNVLTQSNTIKEHLTGLALQADAEPSLVQNNPLNTSTQATLPPIQSAGSTVLSAPVATQAWQQQLGQHMIGLAMRGEQHLELHLNPAELGPLQISLKLAEQGAQAHFISANSAVRHAIEQALPQLREALSEQGISLGETSVDAQQHDSGTFAQEQSKRDPASLALSNTNEVAPVATAEHPSRHVVMDGRIDLYA